MYQIKNFTTNDDIKVLDEKGCFQVIEYQRDLSVTPDSSATAYFSAQMNVRKRQLVCDLSKAPVTIQAGAMQWMLGNVNATTGIKGVGDMATKLLRGKASGESSIKPEYTGDGLLVLEPTFKHLLLLDAEDWGGNVVLDDGLFLACDSRLTHKTVMRNNLSSAVAGGEGLFNLSLNGRGVFCLEADCPWEDSTAAAIAACGLLELSKYVEERDSMVYRKTAMKLLQTLDAERCSWDPGTDELLEKCTAAYHDKEHEFPIIYGDYYFIEAVMKILEKELFIW